MYTDDFRLLVLPKSIDPLVDTVNFIIMISFLFEIIVLSLHEKKYKYSFYFWLNLIAAFSIIFDMQFSYTYFFAAE